MEENNSRHDSPHVDFGIQFELAKSSQRTEESILNALKKVAEEVYRGIRSGVGILIVLGDFEKYGPRVNGMVQMKPKQNPIDTLLHINDESAFELLTQYSNSANDGAIIVDKSGQLLGAGVYLIVEHPSLEIPEDCGTRHKAAASFSLREDIIAVFTLSEETNIIRLWKDGSLKEVYRTDDGGKKNAKKNKEQLENGSHNK